MLKLMAGHTLEEEIKKAFMWLPGDSMVDSQVGLKIGQENKVRNWNFFS